MFHFLFTQEQKINHHLKRIHLHQYDHKSQTNFEDIFQLVSYQIKNSKDARKYIAVIGGREVHPENLLKYCVFLHVVLQIKDSIPKDDILEFLSGILRSYPDLISEQTSNQQNKDKKDKKGKKDKNGVNKTSCESNITNSLNSSYLNKSNTSAMNSSRFEQKLISKQIYLLNHIIRPYIAYLMKLTVSFQDNKRIFSINRNINQDQIWLLINNLRSIVSISNKFTMVGRYFNKYYGHLIVLLTKALTRDVQNSMYFINIYVNNQRKSMNHQESQHEQSDSQQLKNMLEEISLVNEDLIVLYYGKYFYAKICNIVAPNWVNTNSKDFDKFFKKTSHEQHQHRK